VIRPFVTHCFRPWVLTQSSRHDKSAGWRRVETERIRPDERPDDATSFKGLHASADDGRVSAPVGVRFNLAALLRTGCQVVVALVIAVGLTFAMFGTAAAAPDLSQVVLSQSPVPGFAAEPPGEYNGPINQSNESFLTIGSNDPAYIQQQLANGNLTGYIRAWHSPGNAVGIVALSYNDSSQTGALLAGLQKGVSESGPSSFPVTSVADASGSIAHQPVSGVPMTEYSVTFGRGNVVFDVVLASATGTLTTADAQSVAASQATRAGGPAVLPQAPPTLAARAAHDFGEAVGFVAIPAVLVLLIVRAVRKKRTPVPVWQPQWAGLSLSPVVGSSSYPPPITQPQPLPDLSTQPQPLAGLPPLPTFGPAAQPTTPAAWYPDPTDGALWRYFDGNDWTSHTAPR
jgi:hypothetical protein